MMFHYIIITEIAAQTDGIMGISTLNPPQNPTQALRTLQGPISPRYVPQKHAISPFLLSFKFYKI